METKKSLIFFKCKRKRKRKKKKKKKKTLLDVAGCKVCYNHSADYIFISFGIFEPIQIALKIDHCFSDFHSLLFVCSLFPKATFQIFIVRILEPAW